MNEPTPVEVLAIRRTRRIGLGLFLGFPVAFVLAPVLARAFAEWVGGSLVAIYISLVIAWLGFGARCPRCHFAIGRISLRTGKDIEQCPQCHLNHCV
jgi:hypothetical protein